MNFFSQQESDKSPYIRNVNKRSNTAISKTRKKASLPNNLPGVNESKASKNMASNTADEVTCESKPTTRKRGRPRNSNRAANSRSPQEYVDANKKEYEQPSQQSIPNEKMLQKIVSTELPIGITHKLEIEPVGIFLEEENFIETRPLGTVVIDVNEQCEMEEYKSMEFVCANEKGGAFADEPELGNLTTQKPTITYSGFMRVMSIFYDSLTLQLTWKMKLLETLKLIKF